jgi:hypothetical protein
MPISAAVIVSALVICQQHATRSNGAVNEAWQPGYEQCAQIEPEAHSFLLREQHRSELTRAASEKQILAEASRALKGD